MSKKTDLVRYVVEDHMKIVDASNKAGLSYSWSRHTLDTLAKRGVLRKSAYQKGKGYARFMRDSD